MKTVNLVVFTGYPHSGKTTIANFLAKHSFVRLELDEVRKELFGKGYPHITDDQEREARLTLQFRKADLLSEGKNVIIDSASINNIDRLENFFVPNFVSKKFIVKKYLVCLDVDRNIMIKRNLGDKERDRRVFKKTLKIIDKHWNHPKSYKDKYSKVKLLVYKNNTKSDLDYIKKSLSKLLK